MTKQRKTSGRKLTAQQLQIEMLKFLIAHPKKRFAASQIIDSLQIANNRDSAEHALNQLVSAGSVMEFEVGKYGLALQRLTGNKPLKTPKTETTTSDLIPEKIRGSRIEKGNRQSFGKDRKTMEGRVDMTRSGAAYIVSELMESDVYVPVKYVNGALHGDTVKVLLFPPPPARRGSRPARKPEGEVIQVLQRANEHFIGTLRISRKYALFIPDNPMMQIDIQVPLEAIGEARDGDKVVVKVIDWQEGLGRVPIGKVTQALGEIGGNDFEMKKILINAGFELQHSDEALQEAERIPEHISEQEIARRRDFREILTFTIDPEDARDFDDALSYQVLENGHTEIGVHIADVTHYLKPDSAMDKEGFQRSTSVYLVDRVCPMLPEKLSNNLCSLVPHQDRLTFSAVFEFDAKDKIVKRWFGKTVIHSAKRFTYEEAQTVLEKKPAESVQQLSIFPELETALLALNRLAKKMRKAREKNGAIGFETDEVRFKLDANGAPIEAYVKDRKDAHLLIEDFMLLANKEVALYIDQLGGAKQEIPFVYRVHDLPDMAKVADFARFAAELGHPMKVDTPMQIAKAFNELMQAARKNETLKLLEPLAIRTMAKAVYTSNNIGHYGLGFTHYSHFTSPIRRYSDVLAHRILERNLDGKTYRIDKAKLEEQCKHISNQERKAAEAERESIKYKQVEFVKRHIGQVMDGVVSGIIDRGFFVELPESRAEGLVEFRYLDDTYVPMEGNLRVRGKRYGREIKMGDRVKVRILGADMQKRQIDMELAD